MQSTTEISWKGLNFMKELNIMAVSYTHLDVYKRQAQGPADFEKGLRGRCLFMHLAAACTSGKLLPNMERMEPFNVIYQLSLIHI